MNEKFAPGMGLNYDRLTCAVAGSVLHYQRQNGVLEGGNETALCLAICPRTEATARALGLTVGEYSSHTEGSDGIKGISRYITNNPYKRIPMNMQDVALKIAHERIDMIAGTLPEEKADSELYHCGAAAAFAICAPPEQGELGATVLADVVIAACDLSQDCQSVREAISVGREALNKSVGRCAGAGERFFIQP